MSYAIGSRAARTRTALVGAAVLALSVVMPPAWANDGIQADLTVLTFTYQVINPNAQEGEVIGRISVVDGALSVSDILKLDLGGDGQFGGGDDTALDLAEIDDSGQFDVFFGGDVVKLAGPNNYEILGGIWTTDLTTNVAIRGKLTTSYVSLGGRVFSIIGIVSPETGEDSLLVPGPGDSWVFSGSPADTSGSPNEDGVVGTITVPTGRSLYTEGNIVEFHFAFDGNSDLDAYFKQNRSASSSDIKLVIPRGDEPPVLGACCLPDGSCAEITRDECEARGGTYKGDNVPCDNHTCAEQGACCLPDGTCEELFQDECEARGGTYKGDNVPCDNHTCAEQGACCLPDGTCEELFQDECDARGGTYKGDNVPCDNHTCAEQGACCLPDGTCEELFQDECEARGGTYKGDNVPCDNHTCAEQGACCLPDGTCEELFQDECEARGGTYKGDNVPCDNHTCAEQGACCLPDGTCEELFQDECEARGGTYKGDNVPCDNHTCAEQGACCLPDGTCEELFQDECEARGGTYKGDNVPCDNHTCAEQGACCLPDGTCEELFQDECEARGGTYKGDNVPCDNHTCAEQGACCLPDGTCEELFQDECEARGGTYKGDNVPCDADTCAPPTGACCLPGGDDCDENVCDNGKPKSLTFLYTGSDCRNPDNNNDQDGEFTCSDDWNSDPIPVNPVRIRVTSKRDPFDRYGKVWFDGTVYVGQEFTASAANAGQSRLYSDTYITIIDRNNYCKTYQCIHIDTSCCEELRLNDVFGSVKLVAFTTETGYSADADDCNAGGGCEELSEEECEARGGTYNGDGTECTDDTCVEPCDILCPPDVEACAACGECSVDDLDLGRPTLDGDCDGAVITNDAPDEFPIGVTIVTWTVTVGNRTSTCTQKVTVDGTICGMKWYDKDVDGVKDSNEGGINGWRIELRDANGNLVQKVYTKTIDCKEGRYEFCCVAPGTYTVLEVMPNNDWVATTPTSYTVTVGDGSCDLKRDFGNVCLGGGCARTIGYWGNSQGKSKINDGGSANPELSMLRALNLRKSDGAHFDPTGVDSFQSWLRGANATNMAYMLSAQLSAMALNVEGGYVSENDVVYAPGVGNRGPGNHFITIADLMAAADRAPGDGLGADGYTPSGDPNRAVQELRKNALDAANNNEAFVNREPCCFQSPY